MRFCFVAMSCAFCVPISGCLPVVAHYDRIEAPDAVYYQNMCRGQSGPPGLVYYPFHGVFISLDLIDAIRLGIHIPSGYTVQLNDEIIHIKALAGNGTSFDVSYHIKAFKQESLGSGEPRSFLALSDPYTGPDNFGPLAGGSAADQSYFYLYVGIEDGNANRVAPPLPESVIRGFIDLPSLTINGQRYERQSLPFARKPYVGIMPANC
jgi:hypothetical protein